MKRFVSWADINYINQPGSYDFQDGVLDLEPVHLEAWDRDVEGLWEVGRHLSPARAGAWIPVHFHPSEDGPDES